jgi:lipopolysaccharide transport system permease protein
VAAEVSTAIPAITRIAPSRKWAGFKLKELWSYRELVYFFTWRDVKVRYRQTLLGASWAVIQPLFTMVIFSLFFGRLAKMPSDGIPYPLFSLAGLLPWTLFAHGMNTAAASLVENSGLIKKVYFPRLAIPISCILSGLVDFAIAFCLLLGMMIYYGAPFTTRMLYLPAFILLAIITSLGVGLWISALNVQYRDFRYVLPFMTQLWMFATPIVYPSSLLKEPWLTLYGLNPLSGVVTGFRWALLGSKTQPGSILIASTCAAFALLLVGAYYFRKTEKTFADRI